jgi:hypothetical protein
MMQHLMPGGYIQPQSIAKGSKCADQQLNTTAAKAMDVWFFSIMSVVLLNNEVLQSSLILLLADATLLSPLTSNIRVELPGIGPDPAFPYPSSAQMCAYMTIGKHDDC